jgi:ATP-binding protein involved in chromosome partitioning
MFKKVNVPVLGIIENMSLHRCTQCGHTEPIFGTGGGQRMAEEYAIELLGQLPLDIHIREQTDNGIPTVISDPQSQNAQLYRAIARHIMAKLAQEKPPANFPTIMVKND